MTAKLFEAALGIVAPWSVQSVAFDEAAKVLTVLVDFKPGTRFAVSGHEGTHPVHDTVTKTYRHLNFFQHECRLQLRTPRVKLPGGSVRLGDYEHVPGTWTEPMNQAVPSGWTSTAPTLFIRRAIADVSACTK